MAGIGPAPKPAGQRARRNKDTNPVTVLVFTKGEQPLLPADIDWHPQTIVWWTTWGKSPMADFMTAVDWNVLLSTAVLVDKLWRTASTEAAKEIRLREESFGASIAARLRLRMQFAEADEKGAEEVSTPGASARARFGNLKAVPDAVGE